LTTAGRARTGRAFAILALVIATLLAWGATAHAAPPANDDFAGAHPLTGPSTGHVGTNVEATKEAGEPDHAGNAGGHSVWYAWTPLAPGPVGVRVSPLSCGGGLEGLVAVYTGSSVDSLSLVASNEGSFGGGCFSPEASALEFTATEVTTYWIAVDGRDGSEGPYELQIEPPPANDDFAGATSIVGDPPHNVSGSTRIADKEAGEPDHAGDPGGHSVWYSWTPSTSGPVDISTCSSFFGNLDTLLAVYTGSAVNALTPVAGNDDNLAGEGFPGCKGTDSEVSLEVTAGTTYRIAVDAAGGTRGAFNLRIRGRPENDDFAEPKVISPGLPGFLTQSTNRLATKETGEPSHAGDPGGSSVWFSWTPSSSGPVAISTCTLESDVDTLLAVYTGSSVDALTPVAGDDDSSQSSCGGATDSEARFEAVAGTTYLIAVDGKGGEQGRFDLFLDAPPANDDFAAAKALPEDLPISTSGSTRFASKETGEPSHAGDPAGNSVWFTWTPSSSGPVAISTCPYTESGPDTLLAVYTGSAVNALTPVASNDDSPAACREIGSQVGFEAVAGTTYRIAVASKGGSEGIFSLDLGGPPANDDFASPDVLPAEPMTAGGSTFFATKETGEPSHAGDPGGHSVWFEWTPSSSGPIEITACGRNGGDTLLAVYTGSAVNALTPVAGNDDVTEKPANEMCESPRDSEVTFEAVAGTTYRIAVDTKGGEGKFGIGFIPAPQNDDFAKAQKLGGSLPLFGSQDLKLASKETGEPNHAGDPGGHSVWYSWTPSSTGPVVARTCTPSGSLDALLAVYTGSAVGSLTPVASDDDGSTVKDCRSTDGEVEFTAVAGTTYRFALDGKGGSTGGVQLIVEGTAANDDFAKAQPLGAALPAQWGFSSNRFADKEPGEPDHAGNAGGPSVWFKWTAPSSGTVSVDTCDSSFDTLLAVYTGSAVGALTPVASNDDGSGRCAPQSKLTFEAVANTVYRIAIDGKGGAQGPLWLHIDRRPGNDDFEAAETVPGSLGWYWPGSTLLATKQSGEPDHGGDPGGNSVWYSWTPKKAGPVEIDACTRSFDPVLALYTGGAVGSLTPVASTDAGSGECDEGRSIRFEAVAGTAYRLAVDGVGGDDGHFELHSREAKALVPPVDPPPPAGGGAGPAPVPPVANPPVTPKPKPLKCKRGFKKKIVKGKPRCVKKKKKHKHHRHR